MLKMNRRAIARNAAVRARGPRSPIAGRLCAGGHHRAGPAAGRQSGPIIWAAGYRFDFSLVKLPILDSMGLRWPAGGVTGYAACTLTGLPWQPGLKSAFLLGVGEGAAYVAEQIAAERHG